MKFLFVFVLAHALRTAAALEGYDYKKPDTVAVACKKALSSTALFCKKDTFKSYTCYCTSESAMGSYLACGYDHLEHQKDRESFEKSFHSRCPNTTIEEMRAVYQNVSGRLISTSQIPNFNKTKPIDVPIYVGNATYKLAYESYKERYKQFAYGHHMGAGLVGYWGIILLCGIITNAMHKFAPTLLLSLNKKSSQIALVRWYRKHVSVPAAFGSRHTKRTLFQGLIPTRLESLIIFGFVVLCVLFHSAGFRHIENNAAFASKGVEMSRLVGDRSGLIANYLMTLTYLFGGRNQIFLTLTGWKQSTFMTYHKWIARMLLASLFTHTISMLVTTFLKKSYAKNSLTEWWRFGSVAAVAGGIIFIQSFSWLRAYNYEAFLYVHILMAIAFLIGAWRHIEYFDYGQWAYATAAVWCFDRFIRLVRIFSFGVKTAKVCIVSNETLQITVDRGSWWPFFPGAFGYLHILKTSVFWQSHPFTVVKTDNNELRFYVKIKRGVTETLYKKLLQEPNYTSQVKVAVEGPYGDKKPAQAFDQVLLYSGGNGIPGPFAYAKELGDNATEKDGKFVKLYWVIRHWHSLDWFLEELAVLEKYNNIQTIIYVTKAHEGKIGEKLAHHFDSSESGSSSNGEKDSSLDVAATPAYTETIQKALPHIEFREGRPDISALVNEDLSECNGQNAAVITCGHSDMCDEIRSVVAERVGSQKAGRIDLFEELQTW